MLSLVLSGDHTGSDLQKSAKALGEFARKTSLAMDICKTVARKGSRRATRSSFLRHSWGSDQHNSRSNSDMIILSQEERCRGLMNDTDFDRALTEHRLRQPVDRGEAAAGTASTVHSIGSQVDGEAKENKTSDPTSAGKRSTASNLVSRDRLLEESQRADTITKAAVQFAVGEKEVRPSGPSVEYKASATSKHSITATVDRCCPNRMGRG